MSHTPKASSNKGPKDIIVTAAAAGMFKTLGKALSAADLLDQLKGRGPFTFFAPTDEAFAKIPKAELEALMKDKVKLKSLLLHHVMPGKVMAADVAKMQDGAQVATVAGDEFTLGKKSGNITVDNATLTKFDINASNGVIHVIDTVILG